MAKIIPCPDCQRRLQIEDRSLGQIVECPKCRYRFAPAPISAEVPALPTAASPPSMPAWKTGPAYWEDEDDEAIDIRRERRRFEDDGDEYARHLRPHRATMVLTLAILSCAVAPLVMGSIAFFLGRSDLRAMDEGFMDPSGRAMTMTGTILGLVMAVLHVLALAFFVWYFYAQGGLAFG